MIQIKNTRKRLEAELNGIFCDYVETDERLDVRRDDPNGEGKDKKKSNFFFYKNTFLIVNNSYNKKNHIIEYSTHLECFIIWL